MVRPSLPRRKVLGAARRPPPASPRGVRDAAAVEQFQGVMEIERTGSVDPLTYRLLSFDHCDLLVEARRSVLNLRNSQRLPVFSYRYDNRPEGNPGLGASYFVHAFGTALDQITAITRRTVLDGSGFDNVFLFDDGSPVSVVRCLGN